MRPKFNAYRSKAYAVWIVENLPCVLCGGPATETHHIPRQELGGGMGYKSCDTSRVPIDRTCHQIVQTNPETYRDDEWRWMALTLSAAIREGFFKEVGG